MSVCMELYKVRADVDYVGDIYDKYNLGRKDFEPDENGNKHFYEVVKSLGAPVDATGNVDTGDSYTDWRDNMKNKAWSDGNNHDMIEIGYMRALCQWKPKAWARMANKLDKFNPKRFTCNRRTINYITVDSKLHRQGWYFTNSFFKKKVTTSICTTKKEMYNFFKKYVNLYDERGYEAFTAFMNTWEDGMIFECSF